MNKLRVNLIIPVDVEPDVREGRPDVSSMSLAEMEERLAKVLTAPHGIVSSVCGFWNSLCIYRGSGIPDVRFEVEGAESVIGGRNAVRLPKGESQNG